MRSSARGELATSSGIRPGQAVWLRSILARTVIDAHRRQGDLTTADPSELDRLIPDVEDAATVVAAAEDDRTLRAALRTLGPADRVTLVLHDAEGWPASEVAELLDVRTDAAHKRIQRARTRLISRPRGPRVTDAHSARECLPRRPHAHAHDLLAGTLEETTRAEIQQHLDTCPSCPAALQAAAGVLNALHAEHGAIPVPEPLRARLDELVREADEAP